MIISLTGFMGCGKSSSGKALAGILRCEFIDLDEYIVSRTGKTIPDIFSMEGEAGFREKEKEALKQVLKEHEGTKGPDLVLSLGGGTLTDRECASLIRKNTICFYLKASIDTLAENLKNDFSGRPMLSSGASDISALKVRISELMGKREDIYRATAHYIIGIEGLTFSQIAEAIVEKIREAIR